MSTGWGGDGKPAALGKSRTDVTRESLPIFVFFFFFLKTIRQGYPEAQEQKQDFGRSSKLTLFHLHVLQPARLLCPFNSLGKNIGVGPVQFNAVAQSCLTLCNPMDCSTLGFPVHHQLLELAQTHVH